MPSFNSRKGIWTPARERAYDPKTGEIYEGPDREATKELAAEKVQHLGQDVTKDPENIMRARQMGMSVDEFLGLNDVPSKEQEEYEKAKNDRVNSHTPPKRKRGVQPQGGGTTIHGGFGDMPKV